MTNNLVQICLMMDCTDSMTHWIDAARDTLLSSLSNVKRQFPQADIRVAFIGYRDYKDNEEIVLCDFTEDHKYVRDLIKNTQAMGGDDLPENVSKAYKIASKLNWIGDHRLVFHVCDAPPHGTRYTNLDDDYPDDHIRNPLEPHIENLGDQSVNLTVITLNSSTDKMVNIIGSIYSYILPDGFHVESVSRQDSNNPRNFLERSLTRSIIQSVDPGMP